MHGHPWSRIINPDKKVKKETISKAFYEKMKGKVLGLLYKEDSLEDFLYQFWESIDVVKSKEKDEIHLVKFNGDDDIKFIV
jgi:hypothetical protein